MATHLPAEQDEIIMFNELKALFNSIKSTAIINCKTNEVLHHAEATYIGSRIRLFDASLAQLRNLSVASRILLKQGLSEFQRLLPQTQCRLIKQVFQQKVILPLEVALLRLHKSKDERTWIKTCFVIMKD